MQNVEWALSFKPMTAEEANELKAKTVALAKKWGPHLDISTTRAKEVGP